MDAAPRFLRVPDVAEVLNISVNQTYQLVRRGELPAIRVGGRGQWRVERSALERYIQEQYEDTRRYVEEHPFTSAEAAAGLSADDLD
jgi:excisionase family DNA binding protein